MKASVSPQHNLVFSQKIVLIIEFLSRFFISLGFLFSFHLISAQTVPTAPSGLTATAISTNAVELTWADNSDNETGFVLEKSPEANSGFQPFAIVSANTTNLTYSLLTSNTTYFFRVNALNGESASDYSGVVSITTDAEGKLPDFWDFTNVGSLGRPGSAIYEDGYYQFEGQGFFDDQFSMMHQSLSGDGGIIVRIFNQPRDNGTNNGVAILEKVEAGSVLALHQMTSKERLHFLDRKAVGEDLTDIEITRDYGVPLWLKLERSGNDFIGSVSKDGEEWIETHRETITMAQDAFIGFLGYSRNEIDKISKSTLEDVYVFYPNDKLAIPTNLNTEVNLANQVVLTWEDNATSETNYKVERALKVSVKDNELGRTSFREVAVLPANTTTFIDANITPKANYLYRVKAASGQITSLPSSTQSVVLADMGNLTFWMQRLIGDYDRANFNNTIAIKTTPDTVKNRLRHAGMIGKQIDVTLESPLSSLNGSLALKVMPNTHHQTVEFFKSGELTISQIESKLQIEANGIQNIYDIVFDSIVCNNVILRFDNGVMSPYLNGQFFEEVNVGTFTVESFTLGEFNGNLWDIRTIDGQVTDQDIANLVERCTSGVEPQNPVSEVFPNRICGVYTCSWIKNKEDIPTTRKRAYLLAQDIIYDVNTFGVGMYEQPDLEAWMNRDHNVYSVKFDNVSFQQIEEHNISSYWLHENFHSFQSGTLAYGRWFAESTANWATWNYRQGNGGAGIAQYTLNPHFSLVQALPRDSTSAPGRFYHACVFWLYVTEYVADPSLIGELSNKPEMAHGPVEVTAATIEARGHDFKAMFADFAARTVVWDYPDTALSEALAHSEKRAIIGGTEDNRIVKTFNKEGTFGVLHPVPEAFLPGPFSWNTYKIGSTTASKYTIKLKGSADNPEDAHLIGKIITGTKGNYTYTDLPVSHAVAFGEGEAQVEIDVAEGEELYLVVVSGSTTFRTNNVERTRYSYSIESDKHLISDDHIRRFVLEEQTDEATIDHYNFTVNIEAERGTDVTKLTPTIEVADGASVSPASGKEIDFTEPVAYTVTGANSTKDWTVTVDVVPPLRGNDILTFELEELPFAIIDDENLTIEVNVIDKNMDLTAVTPVFTLSEDATSVPASGEKINLSSPVIIAVTAENGVTKRWTVKAVQFSPFITTWETTAANEDIAIHIRGDIDYVWKDANGKVVDTGSAGGESLEHADFVTTMPSAGIYTLETIGVIASNWNYNKKQLKDVNQWGDNPWEDMFNIFYDWNGTEFSATDAPNLNKVKSMGNAFRSSNFNGDLSKWDVSKVENMSSMFNNAISFNGDLNDWDMRNVRNMDQMFESSRAFSSDLSKWDLRSLERITDMFRATQFNQNIGSWNIEDVVSLERTLSRSKLSVVNYDLTLAGWASQDVKEELEFGADGLQYCNAKEARDYLVNIKGWNIIDAGCNCEGVSKNIILTFELPEQKEFAVIDPNNHKVAVEVNSGTDFSSLTPRITVSSGATISPASGEVQDFTSPVTYTVTSEEGESQQWEVTLTAASQETDILTFVIAEEVGSAIINTTKHTIIIEVEPETNVKLLAPVINTSAGATVSPRSGTSQDFTNPVTYTVTAEDEVTSQDWVVTVIADPLSTRNEKGWLIYPNPTRDALYIKTKSEVGVRITDLVGREVVSPVAGTNMELDLSGLASGSYVLIIKDGDEQHFRRIIKSGN